MIPRPNAGKPLKHTLEGRRRDNNNSGPPEAARLARKEGSRMLILVLVRESWKNPGGLLPSVGKNGTAGQTVCSWSWGLVFSLLHDDVQETQSADVPKFALFDRHIVELGEVTLCVYVLAYLPTRRAPPICWRVAWSFNQ